MGVEILPADGVGRKDINREIGTSEIGTPGGRWDIKDVHLTY